MASSPQLTIAWLFWQYVRRTSNITCYTCLSKLANIVKSFDLHGTRCISRYLESFQCNKSCLKGNFIETSGTENKNVHFNIACLIFNFWALQVALQIFNISQKYQTATTWLWSSQDLHHQKISSCLVQKDFIKIMLYKFQVRISIAYFRHQPQNFILLQILRVVGVPQRSKSCRQNPIFMKTPMRVYYSIWDPHRIPLKFFNFTTRAPSRRILTSCCTIQILSELFPTGVSNYIFSKLNVARRPILSLGSLIVDFITTTLICHRTAQASRWSYSPGYQLEEKCFRSVSSFASIGYAVSGTNMIWPDACPEGPRLNAGVPVVRWRWDGYCTRTLTAVQISTNHIGARQLKDAMVQRWFCYGVLPVCLVLGCMLKC